MSAILKAVSSIMADVGSIAKDGTNSFHNYKFTRASDILHKLQPLMAREGLIVFQTEQTRDMMMDGSVLAVTYAFTLAHKDGEVWPTPVIRTGMSGAKNSKGGFDDKALNKCHTSAHKYFHLTLFEIPTGDYDDADADEDKPTAAAKNNGRKSPTRREGGWGASAAAKEGGDWEKLQHDMSDCGSAVSLANLQRQYQADIYPQWSKAWREAAEEEFAKQFAVFSTGPELAETLADSVAESIEPQTKAEYIQLAHELIANAPDVDRLRAWWKSETPARTRFRLSQAEIEDLKQRCAEATRGLILPAADLTFAG